jgi:hypothetical protein
MKSKIHRTASLVATVCIATFFTSTLLVEVVGSEDMVAFVKSLIVMPGIFILIPAMAITGATGFALAKERKGRIVEGKKKRMPIIALIGIFILLPAAIYLNSWAAEGMFDVRFYILQAIELVAGAINLALMIKSIKDGKKLVAKKSI